MNNPVKERIKRLRGMMQQQGIAAFIIPSTDPHISEYVAPHWQAREWFSGFTGSAGTLVVTRDEAGLWTDSRYFLQAAAQLEGSGICLYKEGLPDTPDIPAYLATHADRSLPVGYDAEVCADSYAERLRRLLSERGIAITHVNDPYQGIWTNRPPRPDGKAYIYKVA